MICDSRGVHTDRIIFGCFRVSWRLDGVGLRDGQAEMGVGYGTVETSADHLRLLSKSLQTRKEKSGLKRATLLRLTLNTCV